jgi:hypothetical protein
MLVWPFIRAIVLVMSCWNSRKFAGIPAKWDSTWVANALTPSLQQQATSKNTTLIQYNIDSMQKQRTRFSIVFFF